MKNDGHYRACGETQADPGPDRTQSCPVPRLYEESDYRSDDENRFESLTKDDEERLEKGGPSAARRLREIHHLRQVERDRVASSFCGSEVSPAHESLEVREVAFHRGDKPRPARTRGRFQRFERYVSIDCTIAGCFSIAGACKL